MNRILKIAVVLLIVLVAAAIAMPKLLSSSFVKERIAGQLADITGRPVSLNGGSSLSLSPYLSVTYDNVSIGDTADSKKPLVMMDGLRAKISIFSALWGDAQLAEVEMIRPRFNLILDEFGKRNWSITKGPLAERLALGTEETPKPLALGKISIVDGIVRLENKKQNNKNELTDINGTIVWADVSNSGTSNLSAVWRGENIILTADLSAPFELLRGGTTNAEILFESKPLNLSYSGSINSTDSKAKGKMNIASPSIRRLTEWIGHPILASQSLGVVNIEGHVEATNAALLFPEAQVRIGKHNANGRLQLSIGKNNIPAINGTLAFDTMILPNFSQMPTSPKPEEQTDGELSFPFLEGYSLDLRLSANSATSAPLELTNLAATVIIRDQNASFDIGQADVLGGVISGSIALSSANGQGTLSTNIAFNDVDLDQFSKLNGNNNISLHGKGNASLKLKSSGTSSKTLMQRLNGEGIIRGLDGSIKGVDLQKLFTEARKNKRSIWRLIDGTTHYKELKIGFFIANGTAFLRGSEMIGDKISVSLGGRSDLTQRSLALRGKINALTNEGEVDAGKSMSFFVGGTTGAPLIVPLPSP